MKPLRLTFGILPLILATTLNTFAFSPLESNNFQFEFASVNVTQTNWDYAVLSYSMVDNNSGEIVKLPSCLVKYEVKDKVGQVVSSGTGVYMTIADEQLGSQEDYTIEVSTTINGKVISRSICQKASSKKIEMRLDAKNGKLSTFNASSFSYTYSRPVFNNATLYEKIALPTAKVVADVSVTNCIECENFRVDISDATAFNRLAEALKLLTKQGKSIQLTIAPSMEYKGVQSTDKNLYFDISSNAVEVSTTPFATACE